MKKAFSFLASAIAILAGCAREASIETPETGRKHITIQASVNSETRTTVNIADGIGTYAWANDEQVAVFESTANTATPFTVNDPENGYFDGEIEAGNTLIGAVSPKGAVTEMVSADGEVEYTLSFSGLYNQGETNAIMVAGAPEIIESDPDSEPLYKFQFKHAAGLMKVTYANIPVGAAGVKFSTNKPITGTVELETLTGVEVTNNDVDGKSEAVVLFENPVTEANTTSEFFVPVPTGSYTGFTICLIDNAGNAIPGTTKSKSTAFTVERADIIRIPTVTLKAVEVVEMFSKVTQTSDLTDGDYLIVYEGDASHDAVAFMGSLDNLDAAKSGIGVSITNNAIAASDVLKNNVFTISLNAGTIKSKSGFYIGASKYENGLKYSAENAYQNSISVDNGNAIIAMSFEGGDVTLRYNYASDQLRFRYYKSGQQPIALYKLTNGPIVSKLDPGLSFSDSSVDAEVGDESFEAPTLTNPYNLTVSYESSDEDVVMVDESTGEVLIVGEGTATITARTSETSVYAAGEASYTITVTVPIIVHGTVNDPVALSDVAGVIDGLGDNAVTSDFYYVGGTVSVASDDLYGNKLTFTFGDATYSIKAYNCLGLDGVAFTSKDDVVVGDYVVVYGNLEKYVKNGVVTYEVVNGKLAKLDKAPYFTASASPQAFESEGGNSVLTINANVPWTASINNGGSLKIGESTASTSVSGSKDSEVTVIIPENAAGATYTISFSTTSDKVTPPDPIQIVQNAYVDLAVATATFTASKSGGMVAASNNGATGSRKNVTATISGGGKTDTDIRVYKDATLTLSVPTGAYITAIEFTGTSSNPVSGFGGQAGFTISGDNGSWSGSSQSVSFTASNKQVRLTQIDVTYKIAASQLVNDPANIIVTSANPMTVGNKASSQTITYTIDDAPDGAVLTNVTKSEGANWISNIDFTTSGTVAFDVSAQETGAQARTATLTLKYTGATDVSVTVNQDAGPNGNTLTLDFENEASSYTDWTFSNIQTRKTNSEVTAHGGSFFGTNTNSSGNGVGSDCYITTVNKIANPVSLTFYISKQSSNTSASTWEVLISENGTSWTKVGESQNAGSGIVKGTWYEVSRDLSSYSSVYVRIAYSGSTAIRCIDDVSLSFN